MLQSQINYKNVFFSSVHVVDFFCGTVINNIETLEKYKENNKKFKVYVLKDESLIENLKEYDIVMIDNMDELPVNVHDVGINVVNFFDKTKDYFNILSADHEFQFLTESNKPGNSYRKGIYMTKVDKCENGDLNFRLLRCSTNLDGPTENFKDADNEVVKKANDFCEDFFTHGHELNHVLAQIYQNSVVNGKEKKAKIKDHSDKTKDMPTNGLMAFCTFYKDSEKYTNVNSYTKLKFRLKDCVKDEKYVKMFNVVLYPHSAFFMSLSTNRLYTHEISPSILPVDKIPVRMGYVIRCSNADAVFKDGNTYLKRGDDLVKLRECVEDDMKELKKLYYEENTEDKLMIYPEINFSLNNGDYKEPML